MWMMNNPKAMETMCPNHPKTQAAVIELEALEMAVERMKTLYAAKKSNPYWIDLDANTTPAMGKAMNKKYNVAKAVISPSEAKIAPAIR